MSSDVKKLSDVCIQITDGTHSTVINDSEGDCYLLSAKNIKGRVLISNNERKINRATLEILRRRTKTSKDDILLTSVGTIGETAIVLDDSPNYEFQRSVAILKPDQSKIIPEYLLYNLKSRKIQIESMATGAVQKCLFIGQIKDFDINLPDIEVQKKVVEILGDLDKKIELNRKTNETLEETGQALFKKYFVDNPEREVWGKKKLGDYVELNGGLSYKASLLSDTGASMVTMGCVSGKFRFKVSGLKHYSGDFGNQHRLKAGDLVLATRDVTQDRVLIGAPALVPSYIGDEIIAATNLYVVKSKGIVNNYFLYRLLSTNDYREQIIANAKGSTIVMITRDSVLNYSFPFPDDLTLYQKYSEQEQGIAKLIEKNYSEIQTLSNTRDYLLPKLMSGQISI